LITWVLNFFLSAFAEAQMHTCHGNILSKLLIGTPLV
jgi:hypothetical protein